MPKLPAEVSRRDVIKFLEKHGFKGEEGGNHTLFKKWDGEDYKRVPVPRHSKIDKRLLDWILDEAGLTREQYLAETQ